MLKFILEQKNITRPLQFTRSSEEQELLDGLNEDLAGEFQVILMYTNYSAKLTGPDRSEMRALFQSQITDELSHAQYLVDKITAMGGDPVTETRTVPSADKPREMLDHILKAEIRAIADYQIRIQQSEACKNIGLKVVLETLRADETRHKEEVERFMMGWDDPNIERVQYEDRWHDDGGRA